MRNASKISADFWDYTTLDTQLLADAAKLTEKDLEQMGRPGFSVKFYDTLEAFFNAEALEYVWAWRQATSSKPAGICGPIGPTEQLPLVAQIVNDLQIDVREGHFWAMDEWYADGREVPVTHPLSFAKADLDLCFKRIDKKLRMPGREPPFHHRERDRGVLEVLRQRPVPDHAGRPGRGEALGLQRPPAARRDQP